MLELDSNIGWDEMLLADLIDESSPESKTARDKAKVQERKDRKDIRIDINKKVPALIHDYPDPDRPGTSLPIQVGRGGKNMLLRLARIVDEDIEDTWKRTTIYTRILKENPDGTNSEKMFELEEFHAGYNLDRASYFEGNVVARNRDLGLATTKQYRQALAAVEVFEKELPRQHAQLAPEQPTPTA